MTPSDTVLCFYIDMDMFTVYSDVDLATLCYGPCYVTQNSVETQLLLELANVR